MASSTGGDIATAPTVCAARAASNGRGVVPVGGSALVRNACASVGPLVTTPDQIANTSGSALDSGRGVIQGSPSPFAGHRSPVTFGHRGRQKRTLRNLAKRRDRDVDLITRRRPEPEKEPYRRRRPYKETGDRRTDLDRGTPITYYRRSSISLSIRCGWRFRWSLSSRRVVGGRPMVSSRSRTASVNNYSSPHHFALSRSRHRGRSLAAPITPASHVAHDPIDGTNSFVASAILCVSLPRGRIAPVVGVCYFPD